MPDAGKAAYALTSGAFARNRWRAGRLHVPRRERHGACFVRSRLWE